MLALIRPREEQALSLALRAAATTLLSAYKRTLDVVLRHAEGGQALLELAAANDFMRGPAFEANPIGEPFDPDQLVARFDAGEPVEAIVFRSDQARVPLGTTSRAGMRA